MLPRIHRFSPRSDRLFFTKNVQVESDSTCTIYRATTQSVDSTWKCAVVASKKISKSAVIRNTIKRRIRHSLYSNRNLELLNSTKIRFVVVAKPGILKLDQNSISSSIQSLLRRQLSRHQ